MRHPVQRPILAVAVLLTGIGSGAAEDGHDAKGMIAIEGASAVVYGSGPANLPKSTQLSK